MARILFTAPNAIVRAAWQEVIFVNMTDTARKTLFNRRGFVKELLKGVVQVSIPAGLIATLGPFVHRPIKNQVDKYWDLVFPLKEPEEYFRDGPGKYVQPPNPDYQAEAHRYAYIVNTGLCIGCGRCVKACKLENHIPLDSDVTRTWIERYFISEEREVYVDSPKGGLASFAPQRFIEHLKETVISRSFFVPKLCNQCEYPPCTQVCPVGATFSTDDGVVLVDRHRCIGCMYCIQVCPYGARFLHPTMRVAEKCTWCYHRVMRGALPACVEACPRKARLFGDLQDEESAVRAFLRRENIYILKEELGTRPKVFYQGYKMGVV
jgi:Fe-S-cluster-containing dehydrogenase component